MDDNYTGHNPGCNIGWHNYLPRVVIDQDLIIIFNASDFGISCIYPDSVAVNMVSKPFVFPE